MCFGKKIAPEFLGESAGRAIDAIGIEEEKHSVYDNRYRETLYSEISRHEFDRSGKVVRSNGFYS
jgi:hypothetical protein